MNAYTEDDLIAIDLLSKVVAELTGCVINTPMTTEIYAKLVGVASLALDRLAESLGSTQNTAGR